MFGMTADKKTVSRKGTEDDYIQKLQELVVGKRIAGIKRFRKNELVIILSDNTRLFVDSKGEIDISVT
jgi:hypothetical protein